MRLILIDSFGLFFRMYYALSELRSESGKPSGMVQGVANFVLSLQNDHATDLVIFALDSKTKTFRSQMLESYKTNRAPLPNELKEQIPVCIEMIQQMGFCTAGLDGFEADDIIASLVKRYQNEVEITIITTDKDLHQLINDRVKIFNPIKKELMDEAKTLEKFGVLPSQIGDFLALCGDTSDNVPGVDGVGAAGAKKLLSEFGTLENVLKNIAFVKNQKTKTALLNGKDAATLSKELVTLRNDLAVPNLSEAVFPLDPLTRVRQTLLEFSLHRLVSKIPAPKVATSFEAVLVREEELLQLTAGITSETLVGFGVKTASEENAKSEFVGFSFCFNEKKAYYVDVRNVSCETAKTAIRQILSGFLVGHDLKFAFEALGAHFGICDFGANKFADTMILAWLDDPSQNTAIDRLAKKLFDHESLDVEKFLKRGENFGDLTADTATGHAAEMAWLALRFYRHYERNLDAELLAVAREVEFDFLRLLLQVESHGIKIDTRKLKSLNVWLEGECERLQSEIHALAGCEFNVNSPKQLGEVLFEKLNLSAKKKTKTGHSTDESVLRSLVGEHEIAAKVLEFREVFKLQSTYTQPLLALALQDKEARVRTRFLQTGTATGRLASRNPNLQNIPTRKQLGRLVREVFVSEAGFSLVSVDYSQIELRLLAHFSEDAALCAAFLSGEDIHARSAFNIFGECDEAKRRVAKAINFGLIYGMGATRLAESLGVSRVEAKGYMERYFASFASVKGFLEGVRDEAVRSGQTRTLLGRRRCFEFEGANEVVRSMLEREAVNSVFQGSAADLIKLAMLSSVRLCEAFGARMLLQIHDELVFEVTDSVAGEFGEAVKAAFEGVAKLKVPLVANVAVGKNWGELK